MTTRNLLWINLAFLALVLVFAVITLYTLNEQNAAKEHDRIATICGAYDMTEDDLSEVLACMEDLKQD